MVITGYKNWVNMDIELNSIYQESCLATIARIKASGVKVNSVITSPPYWQ